MRTHLFGLLLLSLALAAPAWADAPLDSRLALDADQARRLASIEASYRRDFAALRQEYNRESRALRRARLAGDSSEIQRLTAVTADMREQLKAMRETQDRQIAALLRPEQMALFDAYVQERRQMAGSSRDERLFD